MQTLVYENYNKFISATDTIRKVGFLKIDFLRKYHTKAIAKPLLAHLIWLTSMHYYAFLR